MTPKFYIAWFKSTDFLKLRSGYALNRSIFIVTIKLHYNMCKYVKYTSLTYSFSCWQPMISGLLKKDRKKQVFSYLSDYSKFILGLPHCFHFKTAQNRRA